MQYIDFISIIVYFKYADIYSLNEIRVGAMKNNFFIGNVYCLIKMDGIKTLEHFFISWLMIKVFIFWDTLFFKILRLNDFPEALFKRINKSRVYKMCKK